MNKFDLYIILIIIIKIGFILMAISHLYLKVKGNGNSNIDKTVIYWKERFEFIFIVLMAILLIYLFNPRYDNTKLIDTETKILLYLFGFILLITAKWEVFLSHAKWYKNIKPLIQIFHN